MPTTSSASRPSCVPPIAGGHNRRVGPILEVEVIGLDDGVIDELTALDVEELCILAFSSAGIEEGHVAIAFVDEQTITVGIGPAGTGKSFLAVAMAAAALSRREVNRIILTRPAVEAGERLGFLPGDLMAKIDPYLRPLFDALHDMIDPDKVATHLERNVIEVAPLAFMRGRTLNDSFVILDEAQNTSPEQMKMFLTRLGFNSKMVITGDITQIDLPRDQRSGLVVVSEILSAVEGVEFVRFGGADVVRHRLVQRIVEAYDEHSERAAPELRPAAQQPSSRRA